ncbi:MAG TPA: beta-galactosidase GalA [Fimbriimonas sp.]|nr:beta-galactosidase GalA [Fimbriimonas sp.]
MTFARAIVACALVTVTAATFAQSQRLRIRFDDNWRFRRDPLSKAISRSRFAWEWRQADEKKLDVQALPKDIDSGDWKRMRPRADVFRGRRGFAWFRTDLGNDPKNKSKLLHFEAVDDNAEVFLNGKLLKKHFGWNDPFDVTLSDAWSDGGPNRLVLLVENTDGGGGISGTVDFEVPEPQMPTPPEAKPAFNDGSWRHVHLPHDYVVEGTFDPQADTGHGSLPVVPAWYRKTFTLPETYKGKSVWIDFDGVYRDSVVWLNGKKLGHHPGGYTPFRYDISGLANFGGQNVLAVSVDPRRTEGWWYEGGGIYRHVWLNVANKVHVRPWTVFVQSSPNWRKKGSPWAQVDIQSSVSNTTANPSKCSVVARVFDTNGKQVGHAAWTPQVIPASAVASFHQSIRLDSITPWSLENPHLYRLQLTVMDGSTAVDQTNTNFGIRSIHFDPDSGFFLNGKPVKLKGTCNHQDHAGVGIGIPDGLLEWRIKKLKEMGSNAYRCSHNMVADELLDACDRLGMLVMDENRHLGDTELAKTPSGTGYSDLSELKTMVVRDRNHPSVIMWSMCNEEGLSGSPEGGKIFAAMKKATLALDKSRPITCAMNFGWGHGITLVEDLQGINYSPSAYDDFHKKFPKMPMYGSETMSTVSTRGIYENDATRGYVSAYDVNKPGWGQTAEEGWKPLAEKPFMEGGFVWTGFDYKGEPTPYGWPCINSHFGILDICGFPKDNFYYYQAWWGNKPAVHLLPHWNWHGKEGQPIDVWCYSNSDSVELLLNGISLGSKPMPRYGHLQWSVPYAPGELVAKAFNEGKLVAVDRVKTAGAPAALRIKTDRKKLLADGEDVTVVEIEVVDANGVVVPTADNLVNFRVLGPGSVVGVGNGDPSSHEPDKATQRHAFNGLCMALVGATSRSGKLVVTAAADGLQPATLSLSSENK